MGSSYRGTSRKQGNDNRLVQPPDAENRTSGGGEGSRGANPRDPIRSTEPPLARRKSRTALTLGVYILTTSFLNIAWSIAEVEAAEAAFHLILPIHVWIGCCVGFAPASANPKFSSRHEDYYFAE